MTNTGEQVALALARVPGISRRTLRDVKVVDLPGGNVVDETVDEYGSERNIRFIGTFFCTVLLLCQESLPMVVDNRLLDNARHCVLNIFFNQSAESRVTEHGGASIGVGRTVFPKCDNFLTSGVVVQCSNRVDPFLDKFCCSVGIFGPV